PRNTGGGALVAARAVSLGEKKFMDYGGDNRLNGYEPNFQWTKPSISLANEANYSDGHCYAYMIRELGIGKLVGMPVPGTCTFGGWEALMDTGIRWGVPGVACKDARGNYLENAATAPDVLVRNEQEKVGTGVDQQLESAVQELLKDVKK
ncbi:MAG TPA: S41 family peptidase, partial [Lacibacter sp.]|nr:S41 family peptidase [Lacibacter sp.]